MAEFVTLGEIMLRLKTPRHERFFQSPSLEATFGGGEANVAVALANFGLNAAFVSSLPDNDIGTSAIRELRRFSVDTSHINRSGDRVGIYFLEVGANQRPSKVVYDRAGSSICNAQPGDFDWPAIFNGARWFHITGITPALSESAAELSLEAVSRGQECRRHRILRLQLPRQAVEVRQIGSGSDDGTGQVRRRRHRQRRGLPEIAGHFRRRRREDRKAGPGPLRGPEREGAGAIPRHGHDRDHAS